GEEQRATEDAVTREVWEAYVDYKTAMEQNRSSQSFLSSAQLSYDSSLDAYKYGVRSLVDVVESERQLAQARVAVVRSHAQLMQSAAALSYATGALLQGNPTLPGAHPGELPLLRVPASLFLCRCSRPWVAVAIPM